MSERRQVLALYAAVEEVHQAGLDWLAALMSGDRRAEHEAVTAQRAALAQTHRWRESLRSKRFEVPA